MKTLVSYRPDWSKLLFILAVFCAGLCSGIVGQFVSDHNFLHDDYMFIIESKDYIEGWTDGVSQHQEFFAIDLREMLAEENCEELRRDIESAAANYEVLAEN